MSVFYVVPIVYFTTMTSLELSENCSWRKYSWKWKTKRWRRNYDSCSPTWAEKRRRESRWNFWVQTLQSISTLQSVLIVIWMEMIKKIYGSKKKHGEIFNMLLTLSSGEPVAAVLSWSPERVFPFLFHLPSWFIFFFSPKWSVLLELVHI